ncbi:MAG: hypothetical protein Q8L90_14265 [Bacteroidota bacterium]|nr:hypothetical protein [Bacteroidota bacterium]
MKTIITNQKNNLKKLTKVLGIGSLISLGLKINGEWIAEYASTDDFVKNGNIWLPLHNCFKPSPAFYFSSS